MRWTSPPTRREVTLVLFSVTVFIVSYNLDTSFRILGLDPLATQGAVLNKLGLGGASVLDKDGRRPLGWRDKLEDEIFGDWAWDEGHVAGDGAERSQSKGKGPYGALWAGRSESETLSSRSFGETTADDVIDWWGDKMPVTGLVKHVPGYTILDNVFLFNGTVYLVTDTPSSFPSISSIISKSNREWKILSSSQARSGLGQYGGKIRGVSWISTDTETRNSTLIALWRTYTSLDSQISSSGQTTLPAPRRLVFPYIPAFSEPEVPGEELLLAYPQPDEGHPRRRRRLSDTGIHPFLSKTAFPTLGLMYQEDWEDFQKMEVPYVIERAVIADSGSATIDGEEGKGAFELESGGEDAVGYWWEPIRRNVAMYFDTYDGKRGKRLNAGKVVVYVHNNDQENQSGPRLRDADHGKLVKALKDMERDYGYKVHIVSRNDKYTRWDERVGAVVKSTIMIGPHGSIAESPFLTPSPQTTLMEFFPEGRFVKEWQLVAKAVGIRYAAWSGSKMFSGDSLPSTSPLTADQEITIDAQAVTTAIREIFGRK